ncbi:tRNA (adenosine(37)-N6)-threonylcarbamoyltransferase complex dimerization subunit type 1 TsaB [Tianweitania sp. BSSL-BM11]|uniref:tRNA (Adenosine(37)-N6)-threonylcarbamoyltransferase complex dimerization subunit type 1 TsaB n=1 Tax=Tianweitania aestuarii TaxID=2814886 RepID=A0ABS5RQ91_9HYPH|nr:tRNA (adenosine(37)-N6)-threonylcarbamoyltransferase complex dimerization subunit type 1 TsaB [Tianweitania aestuarii]MBS9719203.1 tRNA (adenosine(37)-N6)-threonylcarbamoyltransferase complex dimerization subunit type 1 TsaB [Tianweitania aestuarii]
MTLLAIDTSANLCAACVWEGDGALASVTQDIGTGHAELLMSMIQDVLRQAGKTYSDLSRIGVVIGPGSFTGVRVGVSTARGLALALNIPAVGVTTLEALAAEALALHPGRSVLAVIDARREQLYSALYDQAGVPLAEPAVLDAGATLARTGEGDFLLTGSGAATIAARMPGHSIVAERATASIETYARLAAAKPDGSEKPKPLYLRGADAKPQASFILPARD